MSIYGNALKVNVTLEGLGGGQGTGSRGFVYLDQLIMPTRLSARLPARPSLICYLLLCFVLDDVCVCAAFQCIYCKKYTIPAVGTVV